MFQECSTVFICSEFQRRLHLNSLKCSNGGRFFFVGQRNPLLSQVDRRPRDRPAGIGPGPARKSQPRRRRMGPGAGRAGSESVQQVGCSQPPAGPGTASQAGPGPARSRCSVASEASSSSPATAGGLQSEIRPPLAAFSLSEIRAEPAALL